MNWERSSENKALPYPLEPLDHKHPIVQAMGITEKTAVTFGVGVFLGPGPLRDHLVIPVENSVGQIVAYAARPARGGSTLIVPAGFGRSSQLFNLCRVLTTKSKEVVVVEDILDCLAVHQAGFPCVVSLMGNSVSLAQEISLVESFERVVLMFDGDDDGWQETQNCIGRLATQVFVRAVVLPSRRQPNLLTQEEIRAMLTA
jgi:DNA primase